MPFWRLAYAANEEGNYKLEPLGGLSRLHQLKNDQSHSIRFEGNSISSFEAGQSGAGLLLLD